MLRSRQNFFCALIYNTPKPTQLPWRDRQ